MKLVRLIFVKEYLMMLVFSSLPFTWSRGNKAHNRFIHYSYKDYDQLGPANWEKLPDGESAKLFCKYIPSGNDEFWTPGTPLNIDTEKATLPIRDIEQEFELDRKRPSLTFHVQKGIQNNEWTFGYPMDIYHGVEIRGPRLGLFQVMDLYDDVNSKSTLYDFNFATLTFCDLKAVTNIKRSSHQLNGKRYPLEIHMVFFSEPREIGIDNNIYPLSTNVAVMISILGEVGESDNALLEPVISAAKRFHGGDFNTDDTDGDDFGIKINGNFSPSWLLPMESGMFYYKDGNHPVPPCFPISQVYVFEKPIKISQKQLDVLTSIRTEREPDKKFSCTFGLIREEIETTKIYYNPYSVRLIGKDHRPLEAESKANVPRQFHKFLVFVTSLLVTNFSIFL